MGIEGHEFPQRAWRTRRRLHGQGSIQPHALTSGNTRHGLEEIRRPWTRSDPSIAPAGASARPLRPPQLPVEQASLPPGQHGRGRKRISEYQTRLVEKQKLRAIYGVGEKQMRRYYDQATRAGASPARS